MKRTVLDFGIGFLGGLTAATLAAFFFRRRQQCIQGAATGTYRGSKWDAMSQGGERYLVEIEHADGYWEARSIVDVINACDVAHGLIDRRIEGGA